MKNLIFIIACSLITVHAHSQLVVKNALLKDTRLGIKFSMSSITCNSDYMENAYQTFNKIDRMKLGNIQNRFAFGLWAQKRFGFLYVETNAQYASYGMSFDMYSTTSDDVSVRNIQERMESVDLQVMAGIHYRGFRIGVGPSCSILTNRTSDFSSINYIQTKMRPFNMGFSGGLGYDFNRISVDIKYDRAFRTVSEHVYYEGRRSRINAAPHALTFSIAYALYR